MPKLGLAGIPAPTWRKLYEGVQPAKSTTVQVTDNVGMLEAYSEVDKDLAMLNGNTAAFRFSEDLAHLEGMNQEFSTTLIYGDTSVDPEKFVGLAPRYYSVSEGTTQGNVIDAGGTASNNTSVWLVGWSPQTVFGIFPKGAEAGLHMNDKGQQTVLDADGNKFEAYVTHFQWKPGFVVRDWRYVVRIANINIADLETAGDGSDTSTNLMKHLSRALDKFPPTGAVRPVFYCNDRVRAMLRVKLFNKSNLWMSFDETQSAISGLNRPTLKFQGVPIRRIESITNTESRIT